MTKYQCPECGWVGTQKEMCADYAMYEDEEVWSNWICPSCATWHDLSDYTEVKE